MAGMDIISIIISSYLRAPLVLIKDRYTYIFSRQCDYITFITSKSISEEYPVPTATILCLYDTIVKIRKKLWTKSIEDLYFSCSLV